MKILFVFECKDSTFSNTNQIFEQKKCIFLEKSDVFMSF